MFLKKRKEKMQVIEYDREKEIPVVRCSICTGERVAGFQNIQTGKIRDDMLIRDDADLEKFREKCQAEKIKKVY